MKYSQHIWVPITCESCKSDDLELIRDEENKDTHAISTSRGKYVGEIARLRCKNCGTDVSAEPEIRAG